MIFIYYIILYISFRFPFKQLHLKLKILYFFYFFFWQTKVSQRSWFIHCLALIFWDYKINLYVCVYLRSLLSSFTLFYIIITTINVPVFLNATFIFHIENDFKHFITTHWLTQTQTHTHTRVHKFIVHVNVTCGNTGAQNWLANIMVVKLSLRWFVSWMQKKTANKYIHFLHVFLTNNILYIIYIYTIIYYV